MNENEPGYWFKRGNDLLNSGSYKEAVDCFDKAIEINPQNAHAWHNKGVALKHLHLDAEARFAFSAAGWIGTGGGGF